MSNDGYRDLEVAEQIAPYTEIKVDPETGMTEYKYRLPVELHRALQLRAKEEHITLKELLNRAASLYLTMDLSGRKPGSYIELHEPGEPPTRFMFPFWPFRGRRKE